MEQGPEWNQKLEDYLASVRAFRHDTSPVDRELAESAVARLYRLEKLDPPQFVWCQSPWQIAALIASWSHDRDFRPVDVCAQTVDQRVDSRLWQRLQIKVADEGLIEKFQHLSQGTFNRKSRTFSPLDVDHPFPFVKWAESLASIEEHQALSLPELIERRAPLAVADGPPRLSIIELAVWRDVFSDLICQNMTEPIYTEQELRIRPAHGVSAPTLAASAAAPALATATNVPILQQVYKHACAMKVMEPARKEETFGSVMNMYGTFNWTFRVFLMSDLLWNFYTQFFILDHFDKSILADVEDGIRLMRDLISSCFAGAFFRRVCLLSERPIKFELDENGNFHNAEGPGIRFADTYAQYYWHHVLMEPDIIEKPECISIQRINSERNLEIRRYLIDRYGLARYVIDAGARKIAQDECGELYFMRGDDDEPLNVVLVRNSTPEPDGTRKTYALRVPPGCLTARQAVAWTFRMRPEDYNPVVES